MTVRVGLIGAGIMGADHARIIAGDIPGARLQVVCDASTERAAAVAAECGADSTSDPQSVIARADVDAVLIASPDDTHVPLTLEAIAAGKPVLCEKPLAPTSAEGMRVIEAEVAAGRRLVHIGFMRRFDPPYVEMRAAASGGTLGRPVMMHNFHRNVSTPGSWFTGDMAITNSAVHEFDAARFVLGTEYRAISVFEPKTHGAGLPPVLIVLETEAGQIVDIEVNIDAAYGYDVRGELVLERGSVFLNSAPATRTFADLSASETFAADWRPRFREAYRLQNKAWIHAVESGVPSTAAASAWDGLCATLTGEAGVAARTSGERVAITLPPKPALYERAG